MKGIHPEYLLGKKGGVAEKIITEIITLNSSYIQKLIDAGSASFLNKDQILAVKKEIKLFESNGRKELIKSDEGSPLTVSNSIIRNINEVFTDNKEGNFGVYSVSQNFFKLVSRLKRDIPYSIINSKSCYLRTPIVTLNNVRYNGCYCRKINTGFVLTVTPEKEFTLQGCISVIVYSDKDKFSLGNCTLSVLSEIPKNEEIQDSKIIISESVDKVLFMDWLSGVINSVAYINSNDPSIDSLRPLKLYNKKQISTLSKDHRENLCTLPVKYINFNFHGKIYSIDSTVVSGHFRWQPCGTNKNETKLIWIEEHNRKYNSIDRKSIQVP